MASNGRECLVVWVETLRLPYFSQSGDPVTVRAARVRVSDGALLDPMPIVLPASWSSSVPAVASDGRDFFVVWEDFTKDRSPVGQPCRFNADVYGARVRASDGAVLDPQAIPISTNDRGQGLPAVAFGDGLYVVVWVDSRASDCAATDIYAARLHPRTGRMLDRDGIAISTLPATEEQPSVAFDGRQFVIVWSTPQYTATGGNDLYAARLQAHSGRVLWPSPVPLCTSGAWRFGPKVIGLEGSCWIAWGQYQIAPWFYGQGDLYATKLLGAGGHLRYDAEGFPVVIGNASQLSQGLASLGEKVLMAWSQEGGIYGLRFRGPAQGDQDSAKFLIVPPAGGGQQIEDASLALAGAGKCFLVAWARNNNIFATRLDGRTLQVLDSPAVQVTH